MMRGVTAVVSILISCATVVPLAALGSSSRTAPTPTPLPRSLSSTEGTGVRPGPLGTPLTTRRGTIRFGRPECPRPLSETLSGLCPDETYLDLTISYINNHFHPPFPATKSEEWRAAMTQWVPCLVKVLDDPSPCRRRAAAELLDAIGDSRAIAPLLALLDRQPLASEESWRARRSLALTFKSRKVVPFLVKAAPDPAIRSSWASAGFVGGIRDVRLLNVLLEMHERWVENRAARPAGSDAVAWQAGTSPSDPRLRHFSRTLLTSEFRSYRLKILPLMKTMCPGNDCSWLPKLYLDASSDSCLGEDMAIVKLLAQQAPDGGIGFLRTLFAGGSPQGCRTGVAGLLVRTACDQGSESSQDPARLESCLGTIGVGVRSAAPEGDAMFLVDRACGFGFGGAGNFDCWRSMLPLFDGNDLVRSAIEIRLARSMLESGEGSLDEAERLLNGVSPDLLKPHFGSHASYHYDEAKKRLAHLRWEEMNDKARAAAEIMTPEPRKRSGVWSIAVRGQQTLLSSLAEVPVMGFVWFRGSADEPEGRSASFTLQSTGPGLLRYLMTVDPYPDASALRRRLTRVQLLFLGSQDGTPRLTLSWSSDPNRARHRTAD